MEDRRTHHRSLRRTQFASLRWVRESTHIVHVSDAADGLYQDSVWRMSRRHVVCRRAAEPRERAQRAGYEREGCWGMSCGTLWGGRCAHRRMGVGVCLCDAVEKVWRLAHFALGVLLYIVLSAPVDTFNMYCTCRFLIIPKASAVGTGCGLFGEQRSMDNARALVSRRPLRGVIRWWQTPPPNPSWP
eukprot:1426668-Prymnesium_polylepis.1